VKVVISGSSGLIGSALALSLLSDGNSITKLVRPGGPVGAGTISWNPETGVLDSAALENFDAVVHLAGENIASTKWTEDSKKRFIESRTRSTRLLCGRLLQLKNPPKVMVMASATGFYGSRDNEELTEQSTSGAGFLAELTREWEKASETLNDSPIRIVRLRLGVVLSSEGGALPRMIKPFKLGLGGKIGDGGQYISWLGLDDTVGIIKHVIADENIRGPVNAVAPHPVTNKEFTKALGETLGRPTVATIPAMMLKIMYGEMAEETILSSTRVIPRVLIESGYEFIDPDLNEALKKYIA